MFFDFQFYFFSNISQQIRNSRPQSSSCVALLLLSRVVWSSRIAGQRLANRRSGSLRNGHFDDLAVQLFWIAWLLWPAQPGLAPNHRLLYQNILKHVHLQGRYYTTAVHYQYRIGSVNQLLDYAPFLLFLCLVICAWIYSSYKTNIMSSQFMTRILFGNKNLNSWRGFVWQFQCSFLLRAQEAVMLRLNAIARNRTSTCREKDVQSWSNHCTTRTIEW